MPNPLLTRGFAGEEAIIDAAAQSRDLPMETTPGETMTMAGVLGATSVLLVLVLVGAAFGWQTSESQTVVLWVSTAVMLTAALTTVFKPEWARITGSVYALAEGVALGAISRMFSDIYEGIVFQAVMATLAVFLAMLLLYVGRVIKVTERGMTGKAPAFMSWYAAFALMVTIVWLYLEMLRHIALIRNR